jgi:hypothetical protein
VIDPWQLSSLTPSQRADVIYRQAQSELSQTLWRAALGDGDSSGRDDGPAPWAVPSAQKGGVQSLLDLIRGQGLTATGLPFSVVDENAPVLNQPTVDSQAPDAHAVLASPAGSGVGQGTELRPHALGPNSCFGAAIEGAAARTGIPATALASIIDAEAARGRDGSWNTHSRNPRSSAAGLGQFLSGTWEGEAERPGTWLNGEARRRGWLNAGGQVSADSRGPLLALRYDAEASIQAIADYASRNLDALKRSGVPIAETAQSVARAAYLGHHLGPGDAARFLNGGLDASRARRLLNAQVGQASAARRISEAGDAAGAHRQWLNAYVERQIRPERYA